MKGSEFLEMMKQDIATEKDNHNLQVIVDCMKIVISAHPGCDIADDTENHKTPQGCYKALEDYARAHKKGSAYLMDNDESLRLVATYLGLKNDFSTTSPTAVVSLEDFL